MSGGGVSINTLPKISLHDHLDGGLRPQTIIELAEAIGLDLPTTDVEALREWFLDQAVEAVQDGLEAGIEHVESKGKSIRTGQLITAMRHADRSLEIAELAVKYRFDGVVGFDIAGAEAGFPASNHKAAFDLLAREFMPTTVHAGEADGLDSIRSALFDGRALRLGHGVRLAEDVTIERQDDDNT